MALKLSSSAFENDQEIPVRFTGEGQDISPQIEWSKIPRNCREFTLICEDPDAPQDEPFVHWLIYNISPSVTMLPEGIQATEKLEVPIRADQGKNSFGNIGYGGPMPPKNHGPHHYIFKLYALDSELAIPPGATKEELLHAMEGHILDAGQLVGKYQRGASRKAA